MKWLNLQTSDFPYSFNSGVIGLNADPAGIDYGIVTPEPTADSFVTKLYEAGITEDKIVAFALRSYYDTYDSYVDFGFYDTAAMDNPDDLKWISVENLGTYNKFYWNASVTGIRFRTQNEKYTPDYSAPNYSEYSLGDSWGAGIIASNSP